MLHDDQKREIWNVAVRICIAAGSIPWGSERLSGESMDDKGMFSEILDDVKNGYLSLFHEREQAEQVRS